MENSQKTSHWNRFVNVFKKKKLDSADAPVQVEADSTSAVTKNDTSEWVSIYGHGFHNALYKINEDKDAFPAYLLHSNEVEKIQELKKINDEELADAKAKLIEAESKKEKCQTSVIEAKEAIQFLSDKLTAGNSKISTWEGRNSQLFQKREQLAPEYAWVPALFFLAAGILFILGDISITSNITSTGFNMTAKEGLLFAIGLALTAFLIKPLIDRMLEKPFQKAGLELKRVYKVILYIVTFLGITMLFFLGKFRAESKTAIAELATITTNQKRIGIPESESFQLQQQANKIAADLANNWWGQWGMVLSTIVFAIGGAMCLAVAFPSLTQLCNKYWFLPFRRWINKFFIRSEEDDASKVREELQLQNGKLKLAEQTLTAIDMASLKQKLQDCKAKQSELLQLYYSSRYHKEGELYKDGYNRGLIYSLDGDLKFKVIDPISFKDKGSAANNGTEYNGDHSSNEKRAYTRRPFVKIRKMIADNYNQKQNPNTQDGTEFEIVS
jgi:hypothetical protein